MDNLRAFFFFGGLSFFFLWEWLNPFLRDKRSNNYWQYRMVTNLLMGFIGAFLTKVLLPGGLLLISEFIERKQFGLFNLLSLPNFLRVILTVVIFDFIIYLQHLLTHKIPFLWKFHRVHHSDIFLDTSTALRFHPIEIVLSFGLKILMISLFGFSASGVIAFEVILNFSAMFNHSNFQLPSKIERPLRLIIVTPDFHRVHHNPKRPLINNNFGFFLSIWDHIFKTTNKAHENNQEFGLDDFKTSEAHNLKKLLVSPFTTSNH